MMQDTRGILTGSSRGAITSDDWFLDCRLCFRTDFRLFFVFAMQLENHNMCMPTSSKR